MRRVFLLRPSGRPGEYFVDNPFMRQPFSLAGRPMPIGEAFAAADPGRSHAYTEPYARKPEFVSALDHQRLEDDYRAVVREEDRLAERYLEEARRESEKARLAAERVFSELRAGRPRADNFQAREENTVWRREEAGEKSTEPINHSNLNENAKAACVPEKRAGTSFFHTSSTAPLQQTTSIQNRLADLFADRQPEHQTANPVRAPAENAQQRTAPAAPRPEVQSSIQRP